MTAAEQQQAAVPKIGTAKVAAKLYAKLAEVQAEVSGVEKDGTNDFHKYKYTSAEAMLRAIRGPLATRGVVLMPSVAGITERETRTAKGGASTITTVRVSFTFVDSETGHMHKCEWAGQGDDPADKGLGKAYTNAIKTFLREQFLIPQGDDPEADKETDRRAADRVTEQPPQQSPVLDDPRAVKLRAKADELHEQLAKVAPTKIPPQTYRTWKAIAERDSHERLEGLIGILERELQEAGAGEVKS